MSRINRHTHHSADILQCFQSIIGMCEFFLWGRTYVISILGIPRTMALYASFSLSGSIYSEIMQLYIRMYHFVPLYLLYERIKAQS